MSLKRKRKDDSEYVKSVLDGTYKPTFSSTVDDIAPIKKTNLPTTTKSSSKKSNKSLPQNINRNVYTNGAESILLNNSVMPRTSKNNALSNISPIKTTTKPSTKEEESEDKKWYQEILSKPKAFEDGYDVGDITKTILGTGLDVVTNTTKTLFGMGEGIGDLISYGVAGIADAVGQDDWADGYRKEIAKSITDEIFAPAEELYDDYSVLGETTDKGVQVLGNVLGIYATGGMGKAAGLGKIGQTALTTGTTFTSSMGSGMSEAYQGGATDEEALLYGTIKGAGDSLTELLFAGIGKGTNALGVSQSTLGLDDALAKKVTEKINNQIAKNFIQYGIKSAGEGTEEVLAGLVSAAGKKLTYMSEEEIGKLIEDEKLLEQFMYGVFASSVSQSGIVPGMQQGSLIESNTTGRDFVTGYTQNEQSVIDKEVQNRIGDKKLTNKEISKIKEEVEADFQKGYISTDTIESTLGGEEYNAYKSVLDKQNRYNELLDKNAGETTNREKLELEALRSELDQVDINTLKNNLDSSMANKIAKDGYLQQSYNEKAKRGQQFTYDATKITNENEKAVYESAVKVMNDTNRSHEFVEKVAKIAKDKGTNYEFTNNEELKAAGYDVQGKQVNGLVRTTQDGKQTILINVDSAKALNAIVGHETTHILEGTKEYADLQEALFNYAKTKGDFDSRQSSLNELYKGIEGANVDSELTADLVGDYLFTDAEFINSLSVQKPTVFQKLKALIDDLVVRFTGTKEEKQLREVQKRFKEAYRNSNNVTSQETKFSLISDNANKTYIQEANKNKAMMMQQKGASEQDIWLATGYQYNNGQWQTEIKDPTLKTNQILELNKEYRLEEVLDADELFKAYPELKDRKVSKVDFFEMAETTEEATIAKGLKGATTNDGNIYLSNTINSRIKANEVLTHEVQHLIQELEGIESNDVAYLMQDENGKYYVSKEYLADLEEIEARQVQNRANMTEEERTSILPKNTTSKVAKYSLSEENGYRGSHQIENARKITDLDLNDIQNKVIEVNGYLSKQDYSDLNKLKKIFKAPNEKTKIYRASPINELNSGDWVTTDKAYAKNVANENGGKVYEYEVNPSQLYYPDNVKELPSLHRLSSFQYIEDTNTQYSLSNTDNQGRTLTKEQQEYFKDSKVRDENGNLLTMYHGTRADFNVFDINRAGQNYENNWSASGRGHYFTENRYSAEDWAGASIESDGIKVKETYIDIKNPFYVYESYTEELSQLKEKYNIDDTILDKGYKLINFLNKNGYDSTTVLQELGYDGIFESTRNGKIDEIVAFNSNQIKNIDNTNPTSDADIRYSLTPEYGMSHRPSTDYGDASNFEENMPDVFEHPEWYMFGGDGWYKKAYNESLNALRKVRNNPDGEITIYRATIGDTFNEGDWVSPSKAYAEWHNYSNLEGKGKVIELKVKAKDIRFAGDDLNEFGYFPNGVDEYSLSRFDEQRAAKGNYNVYGEDVKLAIAPLQEEIKELTESIKDIKVNLDAFKQDVAPIKEVEYTQPSKVELDNLMALQETGGTEYANTFFGLRDKYGQRNLYKGINQYKKAPNTYEAPIKGDEFAPTPQNIVEQQGQEAFNNIDESSMPSELEDIAPVEDSKMTSTESLFETRNYEDVGNRKINAYQYDNPEVKPYFQEEAQAMLGDLKSSIKGERQYNDDLYYSSGGEQGFYGTERQTTSDIAELLDGMDGKYKYTYADIEKGLNAIINDEGAENNAISKRIEFYLDQRLREGYTTADGIEVPANQEYINMMAVKEMNDYYNSLPITDDMMPVENYVDNVSNRKSKENIAPIKEQYEAITSEKEPKLIRVKDTPAYNEIAEVLVDEPKTESQRNKRKWAIFKANVFDKGMVFEDLSLKENNRELIAKWDYTLTSEARGQYAIGNGHNGLSKSLNDIRAEVDNTGNTKDFYNYMYHKHNVDRMTLASRFEGMENKPVFGDSVTAEQSQAIVNQYEKTHPEFMDFAQDVYDYVNADKQLLVDNGVISQETADLWSKMYPHYVPTRRTTDTGIDINVPLDTRKTGINAPIKKATGGSADILPLFDTLAMRTLQTYRATAKNSFGVELMNTLGTTIESNQTNVDEVIDSIETQEELLQEGKKGKNPTFTVFENGEKITFEITPDMYDALKPVSESSLLSKTIKPLNVASNIRRGLLTEYNPTFMLTNAIKDTQDILINSQHAAKTYLKIPEAHKQILTKGYWYQEYIANGGEQNSYFDNETNTFKTENKGLSKLLDLPPLSTISKINNYIEMIPRLSEYIASRESGRSIEVSMLDAARVTTNFKAGGAVTKWANRNGATFLNASVQGAMQQVRNIREAKANGVRGWVNLATKFAIAGLPAILLNNLVWDDDEEYEELSDYVKQNYYIVGKTDDGTFIRLPKGRTVAVIQDAINQISNVVTGDDEADLKSFIDLTINNLAPNNPLDNNIFSPITQVATNTAWYGGDLLPTRLQDLPAAEQYDESTDMFSRWIGETFNVSPYKVNYLIDQYSGGVGDILLPMMTPEAESDGDSILDYAIAPIKNKFTTNSTFNNQNISDFYDTSEELTTEAKKSYATDEDILSNKYINSVKAKMNELYKQKREIQNSNLSNSEKYKQAKEIQEQINELAKQALQTYEDTDIKENYSTVGDKEYYQNTKGEWTAITDKEAEALNEMNMTSDEKNTYFTAKNKITNIVKDYKGDKDDLDVNDEEYESQVSTLSGTKKTDIINTIKNSGLNDEQMAYLYDKYYASPEKLNIVVKSGIGMNAYLDLEAQNFTADKDSDGKTISGSKKAKIFKYINSLGIGFEEKVILAKMYYPSYDEYNREIVQYLNSRKDISYDEGIAILKELDFKVSSNGYVTWD